MAGLSGRSEYYASGLKMVLAGKIGSLHLQIPQEK